MRVVIAMRIRLRWNPLSADIRALATNVQVSTCVLPQQKWCEGKQMIASLSRTAIFFTNWFPLGASVARS